MSEAGFLENLVRQAKAAEDVAHRPWPLPDRPWAQAQTREDVLLAHWPVRLEHLARLLPPELAADAWEGEAWVAIAAYRVTALRVRGLPPLPGLSSFPQLEIAALVTVGDRPGLWLFSLEVTKSLLVEAAKRAHRLPAYHAQITVERDGDDVVFAAERDGLGFRARYAGTGGAQRPQPGTLEHFLTERYALYTADGGRLYRAELHHPPWRLEQATATIESATLAPLPLERPPITLYAARQDVLVWPLEEL